MSSVGIFNVRVTLRNPAHPEQERELELLVDTGSLFSWVPAPILREIGLLPVENRQFRTITEAMIERPIGHVIIAYNGRTGAMTVVFGEPDDMAVLGVTALESLSVTADPVRNTLVPTVSLAV